MAFLSRYVGIDLETTGVSPENDQIVTCAIVVGIDGEESGGQVLLQPDRPISPGAASVHGISNDYAMANGMDRLEGLTMIHERIATALDQGCVIVAYNSPFDLTMLDREFRRNGLEPIDFSAHPVLDPLQLARFVRFRKKNKLVDLAQSYGITFDAHDALNDIKTTVEVAKKMGPIEINGYPIEQWHPWALHYFQMGVVAMYANDLADYFRRIGKSGDVSGEWPYVALS